MNEVHELQQEKKLLEKDLKAADHKLQDAQAQINTIKLKANSTVNQLGRLQGFVQGLYVSGQLKEPPHELLHEVQNIL
jgi:chromosome segregation ATPase